MVYQRTRSPTARPLEIDVVHNLKRDGWVPVQSIEPLRLHAEIARLKAEVQKRDGWLPVQSIEAF